MKPFPSRPTFAPGLISAAQMRAGNFRLTQVTVLTAVLLIATNLPVCAQERKGSLSLATDWSHRHQIFSSPSSLAQAASMQADIRYGQQLMRRNGTLLQPRGPSPLQLSRSRKKLRRDWSMNMGGAASVGAGNFPAKFSFDITSANCGNASQPDFIVNNTSAAETQPVAASTIGLFFGDPSIGRTLTIRNGASQIVLTASSVSNTGLNFQIGGATTDAANLAAAINRNGSMVGVSAKSIGPIISVTATKAGSAGNSISPQPNRLDNFVIVSPLSGGVDAQATLVAYDNLYSGCSGTVPSLYWAYNTGAGGSVKTSVIISLDGSQLAFIQSSGGHAKLVVLKWVAGEGTSYDSSSTAAATPANSYTSGNAYLACKQQGSGSCMVTLVFANNADDSNSSPYYDYAGDVLYVADDAGTLHKFTGVFNGSPLEVVNGGWPALFDSGLQRVSTSPVFDPSTNRVFVGDSGGTLYAVDSTLGSSFGGITASAQLAAAKGAGGTGIVDSPMVDSSAGKVYVFASADTAGGASARSAVFQLPSNFTAGSTGLEAKVGASSANIPLYSGDVDNAYLTSPNPASPTGNLYVCGNTGGIPTLYQVPINGSTFGSTVNTGPTLTGSNVACSPTTNIYNPNAAGGPKERLFLSIANAGAAPSFGCAANTGCVMSFTLGGTFNPSTTPGAVLPVAGGASGIIMDGISTATGASQVYFSTLSTGSCLTSGGSGGCAVQASQAALQ